MLSREKVGKRQFVADAAGRRGGPPDLSRECPPDLTSRVGTPRSELCASRQGSQCGLLRGAGVANAARFIRKNFLAAHLGFQQMTPEEAHGSARGTADRCISVDCVGPGSSQLVALCRNPTRGKPAESSEEGERQPNANNIVLLPGQVWLLFAHPSAGLSGRACRGTQFRPRCKRPGVVPRHPHHSTTSPTGPVIEWWGALGPLLGVYTAV